MKIKSLIIIAIITLFILKANAQIALGEWRDHLPYSKAIKVAIADDKVYCATKEGIIVYNIDDNSIEKLSKANGLSDIEINTINYNSNLNSLLIGYKNGNIDLINDNEIYNISDIQRKAISGNKAINNAYFQDDLAYLCCGFGIVALDMNKKEIANTFFIGNNGDNVFVNDITMDNLYIYAATEEGIFFADKNDENLQDFSKWSKITQINNFDQDFNEIELFNDKLYVNYNNTTGEGTDTVYYNNGINWDTLLTNSLTETYNIVGSEDELLFGGNKKFTILDKNNSIIKKFTSYYIPDINGDYYYTAINAQGIAHEKEGVYWIADNKLGLMKIDINSGWPSFKQHLPNGPSSINVTDIAIADNKLWATYGGRTSNWSNQWHSGTLYNYEDNSWTNYDSKVFSEFNNIGDLLKLVINPNNPSQLFAASWGYGLVELNDKKLTAIYDSTNSTLTSIYPGGAYTRLGGLAFDNDNNLWITNGGVPNPISVRTPDNQWYSFPYKSYINHESVGEIVITDNGDKWIQLARGGGLFIFNENNTFDDVTDDNHKKIQLKDENNEILTNEVFSITKDKDGFIWVGTDEGVIVYYNPENALTDDSFYAQRIIVEVDSSAQYLLETETVSVIKVDGANRKWIGTSNAGVFLMSEDGTEEIHHFNTDNSPLLSNNIICIGIDDYSGEVYFGTDAGMVSYKGEATEGNEFFTNVYAFPNPVNHDYTGKITVRGLVANSNVKITDISGNIVYETITFGGQAIWDGNNFSGNRVKSGVYLVFCTNDDGSKTHVAKILFLN